MIGSSAQGNLAEKVVREGTTRTRERKRGRRRREEQGGCKLNHYDLPCDLSNRAWKGEDLESRESVYPCMYTWLLQSCSLVQG